MTNDRYNPKEIELWPGDLGHSIADPKSDAEPEFINPPMKREVCHSCNGSGVTVAHVESEGDGITASEMDELGPDFLEDYMSGVYDRPCPTCDGRNVVDAWDWDRMDPRTLKVCTDREQAVFDSDAEQAAERRAGC